MKDFIKTVDWRVNKVRMGGLTNYFEDKFSKLALGYTAAWEL